MGETDVHPASPGGAEKPDLPAGADAETAALPAAPSPAAPSPAAQPLAATRSAATGDGPSPRRTWAERGVEEIRRRIRWVWVVGALLALTLVGRGVVGAALGPGQGTPSARATGQEGGWSASPTPVVTPSASATVVEGVPPTMDPTPPPSSNRITLPRMAPSPSGTTAPVPAPAPTATRPAAPALSCSVRAEVGLFWGGYNATLTLKNTGQVPVSGWVLTFRFKGQERLTNGWSGTFVEKSGRVRVTDAGYNATLPPDGTTQLGYQAQFGPVGPGGPGPFGPTGFTLDGVACS